MSIYDGTTRPDPADWVIGFYEDQSDHDIFALTEIEGSNWIGYWLWKERPVPYSAMSRYFRYAPGSIQMWFTDNPEQCRVADPRPNVQLSRFQMWHPLEASCLTG